VPRLLDPEELISADTGEPTRKAKKPKVKKTPFFIFFFEFFLLICL
jgi:hypothetical protein